MIEDDPTPPDLSTMSAAAPPHTVPVTTPDAADVTPSPTMQHLVAARSGDDNVGLVTHDLTMTWDEVVHAASQRANWLLDRNLDAPGHVGVLLDNIPEYVLLLAAGALSGIPLVGLNPTRTGAAFARDVAHTQCRLVLTSADHADHLAALYDLPVGERPAIVMVDDRAYLRGVESMNVDPPRVVVPAEAPFVLLLTSGTTAAPKAVVCSQGKIARQGSMVSAMAALGADDVTYLAMPLFHSNAVIAGLTATVASGATLALRARFSASAFMDDVRQFRATYANYVGTPLSYVLAQQERPNDADSTLRLVFGNEAAPADVDRFATRFGCRVIEAYGSTEGGINLARTEDTPLGSMGRAIGPVMIVHPDGRECAHAAFDDDGRLSNPDEAIGEMVGTDGRGAFEGYWDNPEADAARLRDGWFWSGDLAFRDAAGFFWFAGRAGGWLRVDGENFASAPVERILARHPNVIEVGVVGVPDVVAGDRVLGALAVGDVAAFDVDAFAGWLGEQDDLGPKWVPTYLVVTDRLPHTGTHKLDRGGLSRGGLDRDDVLIRDGATYRSVTNKDRATRMAALDANGRAHLTRSP